MTDKQSSSRKWMIIAIILLLLFVVLPIVAGLALVVLGALGGAFSYFLFSAPSYSMILALLGAAFV